MALEDLTGAKYINSLNSSNPAASDGLDEADDHLRGIKNVLKRSFPNVSGAINRTHDELNALIYVGSSAPSDTYPDQYWADTTNHVLKRRNEGDSAWSIVDTLDTDRALSKTGAYTVLVRDAFKLIEGDTTSAAFTITLPAVSTVNEGVFYYFKNIGTASNDLTIDGDGTETINGSATLALKPDESALVWCDGSNWRAIVIGGSTSPMPRGYRHGLAISNNATDPNNDIDIAVGACRDSADSYNLSLTSGLTKQLDAAWAAGSNAGGLFSGAKAADTWYHVFLIRKDSDGSIDAGFDTSLTAANIPAGYTAYRRIGSILTDSSSNIKGFVQVGDRFLWKSPPLDVAATSVGTAAVLRTLSVPTGVKVLASVNAHMRNHGNGTILYLSSPDVDDEAGTGGTVAPTTGPLGTLQTQTNSGSIVSSMVGAVGVLTDTSSQIRSRIANTATADLYIATLGWQDFLAD